jgi:hypothetical protein
MVHGHGCGTWVWPEGWVGLQGGTVGVDRAVEHWKGLESEKGYRVGQAHWQKPSGAKELGACGGVGLPSLRSGSIWEWQPPERSSGHTVVQSSGPFPPCRRMVSTEAMFTFLVSQLGLLTQLAYPS